MNKKSILLSCVVLFAVIIIITAAASFNQTGVLLYPDDPAAANDIEYQTPAGGHISGQFFDPPADSESDADDRPAPEYTVNINTASAYELQALLPGIGEKKAAAIVEYRQIVGGFKSVSELTEVNGISQKLYEQIKDYCVISDDQQ